MRPPTLVTKPVVPAEVQARAMRRSTRASVLGPGVLAELAGATLS